MAVGHRRVIPRFSAEHRKPRQLLVTVGSSANERQITVLNKLFDNFEGKLTTSKWAKLAKCSQDTAYRDILDLVERGALKKDPGGGRSTSYSLHIG